MSKLHGAEEDVWGPSQEAVCAGLRTQCLNSINAFADAMSRIDSVGEQANVDFRGVFAQQFVNNLSVQRTDSTNIRAMLYSLVSSINRAAEVAKEEQARREKARAWEKEHAEWENAREDWWGPDFVYRWSWSEPVIDFQQEPFDAPNISVDAPRSGRDNPVLGSSAGTAPVSSARPGDLDSWVVACRGVCDDLSAAVQRFENAYNDFEAGWTWKEESESTIAGMADFISSMRRHIDANMNDADWISLVAAAFREADGSGGVVTLSDAALAAVLQNSRITREHVVLGPLAFVGMVPTTGYSDDPVNTVTGNFVEPEVDLGFAGVSSSLVFSRMFNSVLSALQRTDKSVDVGVCGVGWWSVVDQRLIVGDTEIVWVRDDGRRIVFPVVSGSDQWRALRESFWVQSGSVRELELLGVPAEVRVDDVWVVNDNQGNRWVFDVAGLLVAYGSGFVDSVWVYRDGDGRVSRCENHWGRWFECEYCEDRLAVVRDSGGQRIEYIYDGLRRLVEVCLPHGSRSYAWDGRDFIVSVSDVSGVVECVNTFDDDGRVLSQVSPHGRTTRFSYLPGGVTAVSDEDGSRSNTWIGDGLGRTVGVIDCDGNRQSMSYDKYGNLVQVRDREGNATIHLYDERSRVVRDVLPAGGRVDYEWDGFDRLTLLVNGDGSTLAYEYADDDVRYPCRIIDGCGGVTRLSWRQGLIEYVIDPMGVRIDFGYDVHGDLVSITNAVGDKVYLERDDAGRVTKVSTALGYVTEYRYDDRGLLVSRRDPDGAMWRFEYDGSGRLSVVDDPYHAKIHYSYNDAGDVDSYTDALGRTVRREFDDLGNLSVLVLPDGAGYSFVHDGLSRLTSIVDPVGGSWSYTYSKNGFLVGVEDPTGVKNTVRHGLKQSVAYDSRGRVDGVIEFDEYGRPVKSSDPFGGASIVTYDALGRPVELLDGDGGLTVMTRDLAGRVTQVVSPEGRHTTYTYDECGRLSSVDEPGSGLTRFGYDADSRVVERVNAVGEKATYSYDGLGRLTRAWVPGIGQIVRKYDKCGRVTYSSDIKTGIRKFAYDAAGQLVSVTNGVGGKTRYSYDERGRLIRVCDPSGTVSERSYDAAGNIVGVKDQLGRVTSWGYDQAGRVLSQVDPDGRRRSVEYDNNGDLVACYGDGRLLSRVERDRDNHRLVVSDWTDKNQTKPVEHVLEYDRQGRLVSQTRHVAHGGSSQVSVQSRWAYNKDGQRICYTTEDGHQVGYSYDEHGRLEGVDHSVLGKVRFGYDNAGRVVSCDCADENHTWAYVDGFISHHYHGQSTSITRDAFGRITSIRNEHGSYTYTYNDAGWLVKVRQLDGNSTTYEYDCAGRIININHANTPDGHSESTRFTYNQASELTRVSTTRDGHATEWGYTYSGQGQRLTRVASNGKTHEYVWDERGWLQTIVERDGHGHTTRTDVHVNSLGFLDRVGDTDIEWDYGRPVYNLVGVDHQPFFSITGGIDLGIPTNTGSWRESVNIRLDNPYQITHHHLPSLPDGIGVGSGSLHIGGLAWLGARVYDPTTYGFLTHDPLPPLPGVVWEANPYNYAANNPLSLSDPLGLKPVTDQELAAYNNNRSTSLWHKVQQNGLSWENVVGGLAIGVGVGLMFTGVGLPVAGVLLGAGVQVVAEKTLSGSVDWLGVGIGVLAGLGAGAALGWFGKGLTKIKRVGKLVKGAKDGLNALSGAGGRVARFGVSFVGDTVEDGASSVLEYGLNGLVGRENDQGFGGTIKDGMFNPRNMLMRGVGSGIKARGRAYYGDLYGVSPFQFGQKGYDNIDDYLGSETFGYDPRTSIENPDKIFAIGEKYVETGEVRMMNFDKAVDGKEIATYEYQAGPTSPVRSRDVHIIGLPWEK